MAKPPAAPPSECPESAITSFREGSRASAAVGRSLKRTRSDWSGLHPDLLGLLLKRLLPPDRVRFPAVCKIWRLAAAQNPPPPPQLIWKNLPPTREFYSPFEDRIYRIDLPEEVLKSHGVGSHEGWLFLVDDELVRPFMYNPFSGARIQLPDLEENRTFKVFPKIIVSSALDGPHCIVVACLMDHQLSVYKPWAGWDHWASVKVEISDVIFYKGAFIMTDALGALKHVEVPTSQLDSPTLVDLLPPPAYEIDTTNDALHLVEFDGGLLVAFGIDSFLDDSEIRVLKPNFHHQVWEDVRSLGDWIILLSYDCYRVVKASELPDFEPDSIYIALNDMMSVFHVSRRKYQFIASLHSHSDSGFQRQHEFPPPHIWLSPRVSYNLALLDFLQ